MNLQRLFSRGDAREHGFVLVLVLLIGVLLAVLAGAFATTVRIHVRGAASAVESARAEAAADAAVNLALIDLERARRESGHERRFPTGGALSACRPDSEIAIAVGIEDEAGKINLNTTNERLLKALFVGLGATSEEADSYVDRLFDYGDSDDEPRKHGAEIEDYSADAGVGVPPPKNGPLETIDELDQVRGIPRELIARIKPFASVHSTLNGIDPTAASDGLMTLLEVGATELRVGSGRSVDVAFGGAALPAEFLARSSQRAFTILGLGRTPSGAMFAREAIVEFAPAPGGAYALKEWRHGTLRKPEEVESALDANLPPC